MALLRDLVGDIKDSLYAKTKEGRAYTKDGSLDWEVYAIDRNWDKVKRKVFKTSKQDPPDKAEREAYVYANTLNKESEKSEHGLYRAVTVKRLVGDSVEDAGENGYVAFYKGKRIEVYAATKYEAQKKAAEIFKAKNSYDVNVMLAEKEGKQVTHLPLDSKLESHSGDAKDGEASIEEQNEINRLFKKKQGKDSEMKKAGESWREEGEWYSTYQCLNCGKKKTQSMGKVWGGVTKKPPICKCNSKDSEEGAYRVYTEGNKGAYSVYKEGSEYLIFRGGQSEPLASRSSLEQAKKFIEGDKGSVKYKGSQSNDAECSKCGQQLRDNEKTYGNGLCKKCDTTKTSTIFAKGKLHQKSYNDSGDGDEKKYFVSYLTRGDGGNVFRQTIESNLSKEKAEQIARQWKIINGKNTEVKEMTSFDAQDYYDALKESFNN